MAEGEASEDDSDAYPFPAASGSPSSEEGLSFLLLALGTAILPYLIVAMELSSPTGDDFLVVLKLYRFLLIT